MKKISVKRWLYVTMMFGFFSNFAPPIIPKFLKSLSMSNSMFGWVFAGMALTNFLFSPLWAKWAGRYGSARVMSVVIFFYGISQLLFGLSTSNIGVISARLFGGFFVGGMFVSQLLYIIENTNDTEKKEFMVKNVTMQIVFGTFGFLAGGLIGDISIKYVFFFQVSGLIITSLFVFLFIKDDENRKKVTSFSFKEVNPFASFVSKDFMNNVLLRNILIVSIMASAATVIYDQSFNYYLTDYFNFPTSINGIVKAITGLLTFAINSTITLYVIKKINILKSLSFIFFSVAGFIIILLLMQKPYLFLTINIFYYSVHAAYIPLLHSHITDDSKDQNKSVGTINSFRSLGMIIGSSVAGISYSISTKLPFLISITIFVIAGILCLNLLQMTNRNQI